MSAVQFDLTNFNSVIQAKMNQLHSTTSANDMILILKALESAYSTILNGTAINTANAITNIGDTKVAAVNTAGTTQVSAVNTAGTTQVGLVNTAGTTGVTNINTNKTTALTEIDVAKTQAVALVTSSAGGTNPFLLIGA
jgi:hypothetical protein